MKIKMKINLTVNLFYILILCLNIWFDLMQSWEVSMAKHENTSSGLNASKPQCMETEKEHKKHLIRWNQKHKTGIQSFPC